MRGNLAGACVSYNGDGEGLQYRPTSNPRRAMLAIEDMVSIDSRGRACSVKCDVEKDALSLIRCRTEIFLVEGLAVS